MSLPAHGAARRRLGSSWTMRESGQTIVEWLAVLAGVVTLAGAGAVAMPSVAPAMTGGMQTVICRVTGGSCDASASGPAQAAAPALPQPAGPPAAPVPPSTQPPAAPTRDLCG